VPSGQQLKFKQASAKVRAEGIKPFTKAFGKRMKQLLGRGKKAVKSRAPKRRKSTTKQTKRTKSRSSPKKSVAAKKSGGRKGASLKTRLIKFGAGAGIGALIAIVATAARRQEINAAAPIIDAAAGTGVEGQVGTAIMRVGVPLITRALRGNGNGFGGNGSQMMEGGA